MAQRNRLVLAMILTAALSFQAASEVVDAIVATVDTEVILRSDIMAEIRPLLQGMTPAQIEAEGDAIFDQALEQAIELKILYREGLLNDIKTDDERITERVEEKIKGIRDGYGTEQEFLNALSAAGESISDFRERIRKQTVALTMGWNKQQVLEKEAVISEAELAQYYQDHIDQYQKPERLKLYRIFIPKDPEDTGNAKLQARLEALQEELALGADFSELATKHSEGPFASEGGFAGWFGRGDLQQDLEDVTFGLSPGDVSPIVETETGMMLLMVSEKVEAGLAPFDEVRTEIEPTLRQEYALERYTRWMTELRKRSRVRTYD